MRSARALLLAEWTKIRSVRSTVWTLVTAFLVTVLTSTVIAAVYNDQFDSLSAKQKADFDPTNLGFIGVQLGQLVLVVFAVLVVCSEYTTRTVRYSLMAVPRRGAFLAAKLTVATALVLVTSMATAFTTFGIAQSIFGDRGASLGDPGVARAVVGAGLYMTLITLLAMGLSAVLRSPMLSLGVLMPFFFLVSPILTTVPRIRTVARFLPDQAGGLVTHVRTNGWPFGPWAGLAILCGWTATLVLAGYLTLRRRDA